MFWFTVPLRKLPISLSKAWLRRFTVDPCEIQVIGFYSHYPASSCIEACFKNTILEKEKGERMMFIRTLNHQKSEGESLGSRLANICL